jgi:ATP-dependent protease ClpP protease subunit
MPNNKFSIVNKAGEAEIMLYDTIDHYWGVSAKMIDEQLKAAGNIKTIRLRVNSAGGSIIEGTAVYNILKRHPARVVATIDGVAASMSSVVCMAADEIEIGEGAYMFVHDPVGDVWAGDSAEMRKMAETLDMMRAEIVGIYSRRTGRTEADISRMMVDEVWMDAASAVREKFADRTVKGLSVAASFDAARFRNVPPVLKGQTAMSTSTPASFAELKAAFPRADASFIVAQQEAQATLPQAQAAYQAALENRLAAAESRAGKAVGVNVVPEGRMIDGSVSDPISEWRDAMAALTAKGLSKQRATSKLVSEQPQLHAAYLEAYNLEHADARSPAGRKGR